MRYQTIQEFNSNTALTPIRDLSSNPKLLIPSPILLLMLAACGGCGGGGSPRPAVTAPTSLDPDLLSGLLSATTDENNADFSHELLPTAELEGEVTLSLAASGEGNDIFVTTFSGEGVNFIEDFTQGEDMVELHLLSEGSDLDGIYNNLSINHTNDTDYTGNGQNDTVWRFERGATGDAGDYLLVFEGFTDGLEFGDFVKVTD